VAIGIAVACKITALALIGPAGLAILVRLFSSGLPRGAAAWRGAAMRSAGRLAAFLIPAVLTARLALPYAFLGLSPLSFRLDPRWINDLKSLSANSKSFASFPPAFQWADRGLLFPFRNFVLFGAGPFFGITALVALIWCVPHILRRRRWALLPLWAHTVFVLAYHALDLVKAMRYWYPAYPGLAVLAALALAALSRGFRTSPEALPRITARAGPAVVFGGTLAVGFAFAQIYTRPVTRVAASDWIFRHVTPARFAGESWDDGLPVPRVGGDSGAYHGPALPLFDPDGRDKLETLLKALKDSDWIAVTSNRVYGNVTRLPDVFPMTIAYYRALFEGRLGFERVADFTSYPTLGPLAFRDDTAEEQFTVYDHPRVLLFRKTKAFSLERARQILLAPLQTTPPSIADWERWPRSRRRVTAPVLPDVEAAAVRPLTGEASEETVSSWWALLLFYLASSAAGLLALPIAWRLLPRLFDRGAGVARTIGVVLPTYALALLVNLHLLRQGRAAALSFLGLLAIAGSVAFLRWRRDMLAWLRDRRRAILLGEAVFAAGFLFFVGMRSLNPEIAWGEKPMDFSILNILTRTATLPPSDPWLAGAPLGYYYFGQEMVAWLTLVTGLSTRYTFNLAFGLIGGLTLQGAFSLLRNWTGSVRAAVAGASFAGILGNLAGLREWLINQPLAHQPRRLDWNYFWATSRVVKDTINEYPFWSLLFSDLHAHVLAYPLFLLFATAALSFVRTHADAGASTRARIASAALLGFSAAVQALTNAWDVPMLTGLLVLVFAVAALPRRRPEFSALGHALLSFAVVAVVGLATLLPLWVRGGGAPGWGRNTPQEAARGVDVLTVFGLFFFLAIAWWMAAGWRRSIELGLNRRAAAAILAVLALGLGVAAVRSPTVFSAAGVVLFLVAALASRGPAEDRLALGLVATAFFLLLFTQRMYIYDRMNTFFKLYIETWFCFAIGTAVLVFRPANRPGSFGSWRWPLRTALAVLVALALFTTVTAGQGAVDRTSSPAAREGTGRGFLARYLPPEGPSLDGLRYLKTARPGEYRAVLWLRRAVRGTPVILEAQGASYQDFGRISMYTGLPTVLGWEYHVQQRGNPQTEIADRAAAVKQIYSAPALSGAEVLLRRYHVAYVYVGWLERQTYPAAGLAKFDKDKSAFELAYENRESRIYRVAGSESQDVLVPTHEKVELPAGAAAPDTEPEEAPDIAAQPRPDVAPFGLLREPRDAAVDDRGRIWIADFGNSRLRVYDAQGGLLGGWGGRGAGTFGLREACGLAISGDDLYVADTWNGRVQRYTLEGEWKATAPGFYGPRGVAVAPDKTVWVSDTGNNRVQHFDPDLNLLGTTGKKGAGDGEFQGPIGIAVGQSGSVYVADVGNRRIVVLKSGGEFERAYPFPGWAQPGEPDLEVGPGETLFASDPEANVVIELDAKGKVIASRGMDDAHKALVRPTGVAIDRRKSILYIVNSGNNTVSSIRLPERKTP
jgi:YYY domain-containing protein